MDTPPNFFNALTNRQLLEIPIVKYTSISDNRKTHSRKARRAKKNNPIADFPASNYSVTSPPIFARNTVEFDKIANPYEIGSVNPGDYHGAGSRDRWFATWEMDGGPIEKGPALLPGLRQYRLCLSRKGGGECQIRRKSGYKGIRKLSKHSSVCCSGGSRANPARFRSKIQSARRH